MSAASQVEQIISNALNTANAQVANAGGYTNIAIGMADRYIVDPYIVPGLVDSFTVSPVPNFVPDEDLETIFHANYDQAYAQYLDLMSQKLGSYLADWFPDVATDMRAAEEWLVDAIQNGGTGINATVENALWERARARELIDANRLEDEVIAGAAARGFSLPTGAMLAKVQEIQQAATDKVSTISRDVAIKQWEAELANVRMAVEQLVTHRRAVLSAAGEWMKTWMNVPNSAIERAKAVVLTKNELWRAAAAYYETINRSDQTRLDYIKLKSGVSTDELKRTTQFTESSMAQKVAAAIAGIHQAAQAAAAALTSLNSMAQLSHIVNE